MRSRSLFILLASIVFCFTSICSAQSGQPKHAAGAKGVPATAADGSLDGSDWRMGSFDFDEGVKAGAVTESFNDGSFRAFLL